MSKTIPFILTFAFLWVSHQSAGAQGDRFPYPHNHTYAHGIVPTNFSQAQKNADLEAMWKAWRKTYLTDRGAGKDELRVSMNGTKDESVSEGIGYGMLISVYLANPANSGKADFDALYRYYKRHEKVMNGTRYGLMAWQISHKNEIIGNWVAPDGDIDAAFSLLIADRKWGSNGAINYRQAGVDIINSLMKWSVNKPSFTISRGEFESGYTMSSYHIVNYFSLFARASGDPRWEQVIVSSYKMYDHFSKLNPTTALTPFTFTVKDYSFSKRGYNYGYDSSRVPWRVGVDYLWHGTRNSPLARTLPDTNAKWLKQVTGGIPANVNVSYQLDGKPTGSNHDPRVNVPPIAVGAMVDASNQEWLNTLYAWMRDQIPGATTGSATPSYFGDAVMVCCMLVLTGNMPDFDLPPESPEPTNTESKKQ
jgi:endo-1,4-beta-D-glucanase Y